MKKYQITGDTEGMRHGFPIGEIVWIEEDDGTTEPKMTNGEHSKWVSMKDAKALTKTSTIINFIKGWFHK